MSVKQSFWIKEIIQHKKEHVWITFYIPKSLGILHYVLKCTYHGNPENAV